MCHLLAAVAVVVTFAALPGTARSATVTPAQRCLAVKLDAAARAVAAHVSCEARAVEKNTTPRAGCHAGADDRLDRAFERIEAKGGCAIVDDEGAIDQGIDAFVDALLAGATTGRCGATKLRAAARKAASDLACHRVAARKGGAPAAACLDKSVTRFNATFTRAEKRGCGITGDAAAVLAVVDAFVASTVGHLTGTSPTPGATATATPTPTATATPGGAPDGLTATIDGADVDLAWTAPAPASGKTHVRILRRLNTAPTDAADGAADIVFFGTATSTTDAVTALLPTTTETARTYHYAAFGCTAGGACESVGSRTTLAPTLVQVLRVGGYTLHWRHAAADVCSDQLQLGTAATTMSPDWWKSCDANCGTTATARQMSATGVAQSTTIGSEFDRLGIPVGRVISSEFCRNFKTAELMDFGPTIELRQDITFFVYDEANRCAASYAIIDDEPPAPGTNTAMIGHAGFNETCPILSALAWGEAAIFKPAATGDAEFVTRVLADRWDDF